MAMDIPKHYAKVSHGFWSVFEAGLPSVVETILPVTSDRYYESIHFAELVVSLVPNEDHTAKMNWYFSAHSAAYIGIFDAAKYDLERVHSHVRFSDTALYKEMRATSKSTELLYEDPVNAANSIARYGISGFISAVPWWCLRYGGWSQTNLIGMSKTLIPSAYRLLAPRAPH